MRTISGKISGLIVMSVAAGLICGCGAPPSRHANVSGTITNYDGKKINGVSVVLKYPTYEREAPVKNGTFFISDAEPGPVKVYLKVAPKPFGPPLPPNATPEEKKLFAESYGGNTGPVTNNIPVRYFYPENSDLTVEIKAESKASIALKLQKV
jgi:hypothetical protein